MIENDEYNADAYDVKCRVPGCPFELTNVSPTIAATQLVAHIGQPCTLQSEPVYTLRIAEGYEGTDPDNPVRTEEYGWFRPTVPWSEVDETLEEWREQKGADE